MDRALDDIIGERRRDTRPRGPRGGAAGAGTGPPRESRRPPPRELDSGPRDGIRKQYQREPPRNLDRDWVHDKWVDEDDDYRRSSRREPYTRYSASPDRRRPQTESKLRVENIHFELLEPDLRELFSRIGPLSSVQLLYDRNDRATGTAFVTYHSATDARNAVRQFDGANACGQPIRVTFQADNSRGPSNIADKPARSLFDRIEPVEQSRRRHARSASPGGRKDIDRYVPSEGGAARRDRSPIHRRGTPKEGRRPGERAPQRGGPRGGARGGVRGGARRNDSESRQVVGGRPRKTAEELDAEMNDYWNNGQDSDKIASSGNGTAPGKTAAAEADVDLMVE